MKQITSSILFLFFSIATFATEWVNKNPFNQKVFIENKGQFPKHSNFLDNQIEYYTEVDGMQVFFTKEGLTYRYDEIIKENTADVKSKQANGEDNEHSFKTLPRFVHMDWLGASKDVQIITEDAVSFYYTYGDMEDESGKTSYKAKAFKKIIYKNVYANIDVEYIFPENKNGIKYNIILHPGADASLIKMAYSRDGKLKINEAGEIQIATAFGEIIDHAPISFQANKTTTISTAYTLENNVVSFSFANYDKTKTLVIDPWITNPNFLGYNAAYDIDYDFNGNVYIYGGDGQWGTTPYQLIKLNSTGAIQWVFNIAVPNFSYNVSLYNTFYTSFAIDKYSGSSYIPESYRQGFGSRIIKVNNAGVQTFLFNGDARMEEMWRIEFEPVTRQLIIGGGNVSNTSGYDQIAKIDTSLINLTVANPFNANVKTRDICLLALDNCGNYYAATTQAFINSSVLNNSMIKAPVSTLTPNSFLVQDFHSFKETSSISYVNGNMGQFSSVLSNTNGFNGMAVNGTYLFTYDGDSIKRWNKNTGVLLNSSSLSLGNMFKWGGLTVDDCGNVFAAVKNLVIRMDVNFNKLDTIIAADTIYDIKLGSGNLIYACGKNFVGTYPSGVICGPSSSLNLVATLSGACSKNATVSASGGFPNYSYSWFPNGGNDSTATALAQGTYTVTVSDAGCNTQTVTVTIPSISLNLSVTTTPSNGSNNGTATVNVTGGTPTYNYLWLPSGGTTATATGLAPGTYTVTVTDGSGCTQTATGTVVLSTGIADANVESGINIYPNPAKDEITIALSNENSNGSNCILIYDYTGKVLFDKEINQKIISIDISTYSKGIYFVCIQNEKQTSTHKFLKQ